MVEGWLVGTGTAGVSAIARLVARLAEKRRSSWQLVEANPRRWARRRGHKWLIRVSIIFGISCYMRFKL